MLGVGGVSTQFLVPTVAQRILIPQEAIHTQAIPQTLVMGHARNSPSV